MVRFKLFVVLGIMLLAGVSIFRVNQLERELEKAYEKQQMQQEILIMTSQAMDFEMRLRVIDQAKLEGSTPVIQALSWEFIHEMPRYQNFKADQQPVLAVYK